MAARHVSENTLFVDQRPVVTDVVKKSYEQPDVLHREKQ